MLIAAFCLFSSRCHSFDAADQMRTLPEMLELRTHFDALGVAFVPIANHELSWTAAP